MDSPAVGHLRRSSSVAQLTAVHDSTAGGVSAAISTTATLSAQIQDDGSLDEDDVDQVDRDVAEATSHWTLEARVEMLRGRLARRNKLLEVIRRAYYHDVILVKEELRRHQVGRTAPTNIADHRASALSSRASMVHAQQQPQQEAKDDRLAVVPSIDLREVLPLFAPAETELQVHPCETCGGHLELIHGENKELQAARQEMHRAVKSEQQMKTVVHRLRAESKELTDVNEALQQRIKALTKENSYTLEQLQGSRKLERDQKAIIATLRSKLQSAQNAQEDLERVSAECKEAKQLLARASHDRDIFSASNHHLKEELTEVAKSLHHAKVEKAQLEADCGTTYYKYQEEFKRCQQLREELNTTRATLGEKTTLSEELQRSLAAIKDELATTVQRFEQTKRDLEDQLAEEERGREEMQEQNLEFRKINKKLLKDLEHYQQHPQSESAVNAHTARSGHGGNMDGRSMLPNGGSIGSADGPDPKVTMMRKRLESLHMQVEHSLMREEDLSSTCRRLLETVDKGTMVSSSGGLAASKPASLRKKLSRMPSKLLITRMPSHKDVNGGYGGSSDTHRGSGESTTGRIGENQINAEDLTPAFDEKNFEAYHQELHRMALEAEEAKEKSAKQQKTISDLERKNQTLVDRLEESKLAIETLTGSVNALKTRLNQDSAGAAEQLEGMVRQIEDGKRDQQHENERGLILMYFLRTVSNHVYEATENQALHIEFDIERMPSDDAGSDDGADSMLSPEILQKKRDLRRKVHMDRAMKKFSQLCHNRAELIAVELRQLSENIARLREDLEQAENKIDSDEQQIRILEADVSKLRLAVDVNKNNLTRAEKALKATTEELDVSLTRCTYLQEELRTVKSQNESLKEDEQRLTISLFEKTRAYEREIQTNEKHTQKVNSLEHTIQEVSLEKSTLIAKLQEIEDLAEWRRNTNKDVAIHVAPEVTETDMQTDRWKPPGLILRQRNDPDRTPQRYLGMSSVRIACPELEVIPPSPRVSSSLNQENQPDDSSINVAGFSSMHPSLGSAWASSHPENAEDRIRDLMELDFFPPARAGGRQIKTSLSSTRPRARSKLYLSSDGISQRYITKSPRNRPTTSQT